MGATYDMRANTKFAMAQRRFFLRRGFGALGLALAFGVAVAAARASGAGAQKSQTTTGNVTLTVDPAQTKVQYTVDTTLHMVHGTFNVKSGTVQFDPQTGKADGAIVVLATSGESGNTSRDERMHKEILETLKFPDATFKPTQVDGQVSLNSPSDFKLKGVFNVHGGDHDVVADVHTEFTGDHWKGTAKFDVPYIQWGIKDPSNFFLKVKPVVHVEVELIGTQTAASAAK
jgi:polyisoprenoid-binding protein YceI